MERLQRTQRQERLEVTCRRFAVLSGIRQEADDYIACLQPRSGRKGTLALLTEPAGEHPALSAEVCRLARKIIADQYLADTSLSMTSGLTAALDAANNAVLRYNYASALGESNLDSSPLVAVRAGGARARRFKVGLSAALLRSDGTGIYLAQMAPAQAYIRHNGLLTPVPETPYWRSRGNNKANRPQLTILRRDQDSSDFDEAEEFPPDFSQDHLLSPSLGTAPGVESNPIYRRIEDGDLVVLVTSSLARLLDRETAEEVMSGFDADAVTEALLELAISHGLAQAHACVLAFGGPTSSGIDVQWSGPEIVTVDDEAEASLAEEPQAIKLQAQEAGEGAQPLQGTPVRPALTLVEPDPTRPRYDDLDEDDFRLPWETPPLEVLRSEESAEVEEESGEPESPASLHAAMRPTRLLVQHQLERPPFQAPILWEDDFEEELGELNFDGWEDSPPALSTLIEGEEEVDLPDPEQVVFPWQREPRFQPLGVVSQDMQIETAADPPFPPPDLFGTGPLPYGSYIYEPAGQAEASKPRSKWVPKLALPRISVPRLSMPTLPRISMPKGPDLLKVGRNVATWTRNTAQNMLPERTFRLPRPAMAGGGNFAVPVRLLTLVALVVVVGILAWSVFKAVGDNQQAQVNTLLEQAKQEELLANQPGTNETERIALLQSALQHAQQAAAAEPGSPEAQVFADKVRVQLDRAQGITRLSLALLFQFGQEGAAGEVAGDMQSGTSSTDIATTTPADLIVAGNEAFVLDRAAGAVYKCNVSAKACVKALGAGDVAGGQSAGKPVAITTRQGSILVLDDKLSVYVYNGENGSWSAEQLGDAGKLGVPKDIATYDGNLYLLASKPGQVSKYFAGKYGEPPADWITDPATVEQLSNPVAVAIDGSIYVLLADGKILAMQGGNVMGSITPKPGPSAAPATDIFTSPDTRDLYVLKSTGGAVTRLGKDGQTVATFMGPAGGNPITFNGFTVDEAKGEMYLVSGNRVYHASLSGGTPPAQDTTPGSAGSESTDGATTQGTGGEQPGLRPTAEP
ncbi:MAG: hypothetical protein M3437_03255 [Chloroflexota bacterium]|nr:hypothetical protein [Chloroflexota bacterium]MDQ5866078.1 hypothetical protein [Chloroflexota bacterium]